MLTQHLDTYQRQVFTRLNDASRILVKGGKHSGKSHLLRTISADQILKGKKILYAVRSSQSAHETILKMQQYFLKTQCLELFPQTTLTQDALNRLRLTLKGEPVQFNETEYDSQQNRIKSLSDLVRDFYKGLNQSALFGRKWHELVVLQSFDKSASQTLHFNQILNTEKFDFTQEEFTKLYQVIQVAFEFYKNGQAYTESLFTGKNYQYESGEVARTALTKWIFEAKKRITNSILSISLFLAEDVRDKEDRFIRNCGPVRIQLEELISGLNLYQIQNGQMENQGKPGLLGWFANSGKAQMSQLEQQHESLLEKYFSLMQKINSVPDFVQYFDHTEPAITKFDAKAMMDHLEAIRFKLNGVNKYLDGYIRRQISSISMHNSGNTTLMRIDRELDEMYKWLNDQEILNRHFERTAFSINKQLVQLEGMLTEMNEIQQIASRFLPYYNWNHFMRELDQKSRHLVDKMLLFQPKDWIAFFRNWYIQNLIIHQKDPYLDQVESQVTELKKTLVGAEQLEVQKYISEKSNQTQEVVTLLRDKNRPLYRELLKKTTDIPLDYKDLLRDHFDMISHVFPMQLITFEHLDSLRDMPSGTWDVLLIDADEWIRENPGPGNNFLQLGKQVIFADGEGGQDFLDQCSKEGELAVVFELKGYHLQNIILLDEMVSTERLYAARNIAHLMQDNNPDISIYQLGSDIIYSCLSAPLNTVFEKLMESRAIKKIRVLESPFHSLVENILDVNSNQFLITQDFLINNNHYDTVSWQMLVKEKISRAGIKIIDLSTSALLKEPLTVMLEFIETYFAKSV